jgi:predicted hotdog family 3-hydroxylacyl-ACP dehydratase
MTEPCPWPLEELLPHRAPLLLLERICAVSEDSLTASLTIHPNTEFLEAEGVPAHIGIEYMAQACAAFAGNLSRAAGGLPRIGFLLGSRRFAMHRPWYRLGETLHVSVTLVYRDEAMGSFSGRIELAGQLAAEADLTVYEPPTHEDLPT